MVVCGCLWLLVALLAWPWKPPLVSSSINTRPSGTRNGYMISRLNLRAFINIFPEFTHVKIVSPEWVTIIIYILRAREREIWFDSIRRKVCVRACVYARERQTEREREAEAEAEKESGVHPAWRFWQTANWQTERQTRRRAKKMFSTGPNQ